MNTLVWYKTDIYIWFIGRVTTGYIISASNNTGMAQNKGSHYRFGSRGLGDINSWPHKIHSNKEYLIFVETSLTGWLTRDGEEKVFTYLTSYAKARQGACRAITQKNAIGSTITTCVWI